MYQYPRIIIACLVVALTPFSIFAQDLTIDDRDLDGQSIKLGETDLVPSIRIDFQSTDNTFRSENDELSSERFILNPELTWFAERRLLSLRAKYEGNYATGSEDVSDFDDHLLGFTADAEFSSRHRSKASLSIAREHDDVGTGILSDSDESDPNEVAESTELDVVGRHTFGAADARGNLSGGFRVQSVDYTNQPTFTNGRDYLRLEPFLRFSYRVSPDTQIILGGRISDLDFDDDRNDRLDTSLFTGLNFAATGKLSGIFRIGATQSDFDFTARSDETSLFLDADLSYQPTSFALLRLELRREIDNARGSFQALDTAFENTLIASWDHDWSSRISTYAEIEIEQFDGICPEPSDVVTTPSFEIEYALRRWIAFGLSTSFEQRVASNCADTEALDTPLDDYERADFGFFVRGSL